LSSTLDSSYGDRYYYLLKVGLSLDDFMFNTGGMFNFNTFGELGESPPSSSSYESSDISSECFLVSYFCNNAKFDSFLLLGLVLFATFNEPTSITRELLIFFL